MLILKKLWIYSLLALCLLGTNGISFAATENNCPYRYLAEYYAPVIYQDMDTQGKGDHADGGRADYITNLNFDGNWNACDNWENEPKYPLKGYVYYSVVESDLRYYIILFDSGFGCILD